MAKKYRLLKDLPFAKAGEEFKEMHDDGRIVLAPEDWDQHRHEIDINDIKNFDEWFEEIKELEQIYYVDSLGGYVSEVELIGFPTLVANLKSIGNYFETREEAEKYLKYLKAEAIIKQDTKGFKPDWDEPFERKIYGMWNVTKNRLDYIEDAFSITDSIYFNTVEDIKESFKKHPEEWKTYLNCEQ